MALAAVTIQPQTLGAMTPDLHVEIALSRDAAAIAAMSRALIEKFILASSAPGDLVVDPFVGSGTTAVVAARLGRRFLCADADAGYVGLARTRLEGTAAGPTPPPTAPPRARAPRAVPTAQLDLPTAPPRRRR